MCVLTVTFLSTFLFHFSQKLNMRLSPHVPLLLGILSLGTATYTASHQANETILEKQLDVFECRCGASEFLTLPHANITTSEEALKCSEYS